MYGVTCLWVIAGLTESPTAYSIFSMIARLYSVWPPGPGR